MVATTVTTKEQLYWTPQSSVLLAIIVRVGLLLQLLMVFSVPLMMVPVTFVHTVSSALNNPLYPPSAVQALSFLTWVLSLNQNVYPVRMESTAT